MKFPWLGIRHFWSLSQFVASHSAAAGTSPKVNHAGSFHVNEDTMSLASHYAVSPRKFSASQNCNRSNAGSQPISPAPNVRPISPQPRSDTPVPQSTSPYPRTASPARFSMMSQRSYCPSLSNCSIAEDEGADVWRNRYHLLAEIPFDLEVAAHTSQSIAPVRPTNTPFSLIPKTTQRAPHIPDFTC